MTHETPVCNLWHDHVNSERCITVTGMIIRAMDCSERDCGARPHTLATSHDFSGMPADHFDEVARANFDAAPKVWRCKCESGYVRCSRQVERRYVLCDECRPPFQADQHTGGYHG